MSARVLGCVSISRLFVGDAREGCGSWLALLVARGLDLRCPGRRGGRRCALVSWARCCSLVVGRAVRRADYWRNRTSRSYLDRFMGFCRQENAACCCESSTLFEQALRRGMNCAVVHDRNADQKRRVANKCEGLSTWQEFVPCIGCPAKHRQGSRSCRATAPWLLSRIAGLPGCAGTGGAARTRSLRPAAVVDALPARGTR